MVQWRKHLPDDCPPEDAIFSNGVVYRLANKPNFDENDFLSYRELYPYRQWDGISECVAGGISIYTDIEGIKRLKRRVKAMRDKPILKGELKENHGKMKNTPSETHPSHHTWWIPIGVDAPALFQVIKAEDGE